MTWVGTIPHGRGDRVEFLEASTRAQDSSHSGAWEAESGPEVGLGDKLEAPYSAAWLTSCSWVPPGKGSTTFQNVATTLGPHVQNDGPVGTFIS